MEDQAIRDEFKRIRDALSDIKLGGAERSEVFASVAINLAEGLLVAVHRLIRAHTP